MEKRVQAGKTIMERRGWCIDPAIWRGRFCRLSVDPLLGVQNRRFSFQDTPLGGILTIYEGRLGPEGTQNGGTRFERWSRPPFGGSFPSGYLPL